MTAPMVRIKTPGQQIVEVLEQQIVEAVSQLSDAAKQQILQQLILDYDSWEDMHATGQTRMRAICRERGIDWDALSDQEQDDLIDHLLHEESLPGSSRSLPVALTRGAIRA